ncbi:MAG: DUF3352 domain-containing protein [Candidatus Poribacteria bacterium]|nr:DUF3352 domain-containing protein [Candidatus Poribacteria bacterium]
MKNYLPLHIIALLLLTTFAFIGCSAKETAPPDTAEIPLTQEPVETEESLSPEAEMTEKPQAPEADADDESHSPEAEMAEKPQAPEQETLQETEPEETMPTVEIPSDSVLHLIPESTLGVIYCPSLTELDNRINMLATDLLPTAEPPEVLAGILADVFGAGFENLAELEQIGLDLNQDFAIFMTSLKPPDLSATVHLTDPAAMKQVIDAESEGTAPIKYNGVTYWNAAGGGGSFAIIDNVLVFTRSPDVCESVIDAYKKTNPSITTKPNYNSFLTDVAEGGAQLAIHFDLESVIPGVTASLNAGLESAIDDLESDPSVMAAIPFFNLMFDAAIDVLSQLQSLSATLEVEGTDVQIDQLLKFKTGSKIQNTLKEMDPHQLALLDRLPKQAFVNGGFQSNPEFLAEMGIFWLRMLAADAAEQSELLKTVIEQIEGFYDALADEWAFTMNYSDSLLPDYLIIYELKNEQQARTYMEKTFLEQLQNTVKLIQDTVGDMPQLNMYDGAHLDTPMTHNGIEIKTFVFPNFNTVFEDIPAPTSSMMPQEWKWSYAFHENHLLLAIGGPELIKTALDRQTGETLAENLSYQKLIGMLGTDNNLLLAVSPMTAAKSFLPILAKADPDAAAPMQMLSGMLMNMPETYSIGFSAKAEAHGIDTKLLLTLGDFKQLIQMMAMVMQSTGQMQ